MSGMSREPSIDRLSSLPEEVICHILSFLRIKLSVSTCVLAKRWRFLWAHVPVLDFDPDLFRNKTQPITDVIYRIIMRHKAKTLHTLRLNRLPCNEYQLESWVTAAMERNLRNLHIDFGFGIGSIAFLHKTLFTCKTMVDMRLDNARGLHLPRNIYLPSLKKLHLSRVDFEDNEALSQLLSGCPLLQELILNHVVTREIHCYVNISSSTIKRLDLSFERNSKYVLNYKIIIDAPAIRRLCVGNCDLGCITFPIYMTSLVEVDFCFRKCYGWWKIDNSNQSNLVEFFNHLHQIRCLKLSCCCYLQVIDRVVGSIENFNNLTKLELELGVEWQLLVEFLEVADNLQVLIVTGSCRCYHKVEIRSSCMEPKQVPKCLLSSLKTIAIKQPSFEEHELDLVRYLLRNSQVLERMKILPPKHRSTSTSNSFLEALQRIALFERGSKACQLVSDWTEQVINGQWSQVSISNTFNQLNLLC